MNTKDTYNKELNELSTVLSSIQKTPNVLPEDYFESFPSRMMQKIEAQKQTQIKIRVLFQKLALAASLVLLIGLGIYVFSIEQNSIKANTSTEISMVDDTYLYEIDEADIIEIAVMNNGMYMSDSIINMYEDFNESDILELYN